MKAQLQAQRRTRRPLAQPGPATFLPMASSTRGGRPEITPPRGRHVGGAGRHGKPVLCCHPRARPTGRSS
eukprot:3310618-Lingulodinium_polyedra.AAC.1